MTTIEDLKKLREEMKTWPAIDITSTAILDYLISQAEKPEEKGEEPKEKWVPSFGERYFYVTANQIGCGVGDAERISMNDDEYKFVYRTYEEAEAAAEKVKNLLLSL